MITEPARASSADEEESGPRSSDRAFGLVFAVFFSVVAALPLLHGLPARSWALAVAAGFLAVALAAPRALAPLNRLWARFGELLGRITSPVALGIIYYCVVVPTGIAMRLAGKDPLRLKLDRNAQSYWITRKPPGPSAESLKDQF